MKIKFCGAAREVTGSSHLLLLDNGLKILLDCGLYQGNDDDMDTFNQNWYFDPKEIDYVILSHAHIDHSGKLPLLYKHGFRGQVFSTHATRSLCAIMLLDSAMIHVREAEYYNKNFSKNDKDKKSPLYESEHVTGIMSLFHCLAYDNWNQIHPGIKLLFLDAGHILGSASITLEIEEGSQTTRFGFTGDIGRPDRPILRDPKPLPPVDYLLCESTYGDRIHESKPEETYKFVEIIEQTCVQNKGKVIIPAFSVGRTQEIVYMMDSLYNSGDLPRVPIYVDSPLAMRATEVYGSHPECYDNQLHEYLLTDDNPFGFNSLTYVKSVEESKALNTSDKPCVIISASGMATAGRIRHHLFHNIEDPKNTILMIGYCAPYTPGGALIAGVPSINIHGQNLQVNARVEKINSLSAHGDQYEMLNVIKNQIRSLKELFLVHGDYDTQVAFRDFLEKHGFNNINIPSLKFEKTLN